MSSGTAAASTDEPPGRRSVVAIHGVGNHPEGEIAALIQRTLPEHEASLWEIRELNWDQYVRAVPGAAYARSSWAIGRVSANGHQAARLAVLRADPGWDASLAQMQLRLCDALRVTTSIAFTAVLAAPILLPPLILLAPDTRSTLLAPATMVGFASRVINAIVLAVAGMLAMQGLLGLARAAVSRSLSRVQGTASSMALSVLTPVIVLLSIPIVIDWAAAWIFALMLGGALVAVSLLGWAFLSVFPLDEEQRSAFATILRYAGVLSAILVAAQSLHWLLSNRWTAGPIKVLADILRYLGEPSYRSSLLTRFGATVRAEQLRHPERTIVILAHSLGTIIALDWLANGDGVEGDEQIDLITMGCPYRRYFLRCFAGVLFDVEPSRTADVIAERVRRFRWLNVYRPWDYVGGALHLAEAGIGQDCGSGQWTRWEGHGNYWGDRRVLELISNALPHVEIYRPRATHPPPANRRVLFPLAATAPPQTSDSLLTTAIALYVGLLAFSVATMLIVRERSLAAERRLLAAEGEAVAVTVTHQRFGVGEDGERHRFTLETAAGATLPPLVIDPDDLLSSTHRMIDYRSLIAKVREDCQLESGKDAWYVPRLNVPCRSRRPIEVLQLRSDRSRLLFRCCPARLYLRELPILAVQVVIAGYWFGAVMFPVIYALIVIYLVFLGRSIDNDWDFEL